VKQPVKPMTQFERAMLDLERRKVVAQERQAAAVSCAADVSIKGHRPLSERIGACFESWCASVRQF
jgi:hypothetical protein